MSDDRPSVRDGTPAPAAAGRAAADAAIRLPAEVTFGNARAALEQALAGADGAPLLFDLSACRHFDSSLIAVLLELGRRASRAGRHWAFVGASPNLRKLSGLYGVEAMLFGPDSSAGSTETRSGP